LFPTVKEFSKPDS